MTEYQFWKKIPKVPNLENQNQVSYTNRNGYTHVNTHIHVYFDFLEMVILVMNLQCITKVLD